MTTGEGSLVRLEDGNLVESDVLRVAQAVQDYDSNLVVQVLERPERLDQAPYRLVEKGKDGQWRIVFDIWELDDRILHRIYAIDTYKQDVLGNLDKNNQAIRDNEKKAREQIHGHVKEIVASVIDSPKDTYTAPVDGKIIPFRSIPKSE